MSVSFSPIGPWFLLALASLAVMVLTVWAYQQRLRGTAGRWRWVALGLRLSAVLLCLLAALRPTVVLQEKRKQASSIVFLIDRTHSMSLADEVRGQKRYDVARRAMDQALKVAGKLGPDLEVKSYAFDTALHDFKPDDKSEPDGRETDLGTTMVEAARRHSGARIAAEIVLSDGASNGGVPPLIAARQLRSQQVPVVTVPFGSETAGASSRDIAVRDLVTAPTVFVKNQLQVKGTVLVRGFPNQPLDVEMYVEGQDKPVATKRVQAPEGTEVIPISGLKYMPQSPGEKKVTLKVKPREGELIQSNNEISTFVTVLKGGLNVLYLQGPNFTWEFRYLYGSIGSSPDIQVDAKVLRRPAVGDAGELKDTELADGKYDVYILGDLPADHLTRAQQRRLADLVEKGAGLMMLGGRSSFGAGGWAGTELARVLPMTLHPGDGQLEPEGGVKFVPNPDALDNYVLQVGADRSESARMWNELPPMPGTNRFGSPKPGAIILGRTGGPAPEPVMMSSDAGNGRVLAFGGETWVWARASDNGRNAHRKFWRQAILWMSHKEDKGENQIKLKLDNRRIAVGQKLELTVTAHDAKGQPIPDLSYEMRVAPEGQDAKSEPVDHYPQADGARGTYYARGAPGTYKATVTATKGGQPIGTDTVRFLVYQDDREMENPAADRALLRQIAEITGGESLAPEGLDKYLSSLGGKMVSEYVTQSEHKIWDNWPFLLLFVAVLTLEWWLRKRHGWV